MTSRIFRQLTLSGALAAAALAAQVAQAQQPAAAPGQQQPGAAGQGAPGAGGQARPGGGAARPPAPPPAADGYDGFRSIFDGTLSGWDGDPTFWRVENGMIVAESTPEKVVTNNTFLIWRAGTVKDFEMKVDVRFAAAQGNSGIQVRSKPSGPTTAGVARPWGIVGPQVDIVSGATAGNALIYEEGGRGHLARQGQITRRITNADSAGTAGFTLVGTLGENITSAIKPAGEWNTFHVVARGNQLSVFVNGRLSAMTIDDDAPRRSLEGLLALQMHTGQPFRLEFKNIYLKEM